MVAFARDVSDGVRSAGLATRWTALLKEETVEVRLGGGDLHTAGGVKTMRAAQPDEVATRRSSGVLDDDGGATTGVVYPLLARMLCLGDVVRELVGGCSGFVCAAAEGLHSHRPSTFSADGIGGARSDGRLRDVCFGLRTVASAEQPNRRGATSSLRWVLLDSYTELFLRAFSPSAWDRLDLTLVPGHDLRAGAHRDRRRVDVCVYVCNALFGGAQTGCDDRQPPTSFYNRTGPPHRARSS